MDAHLNDNMDEATGLWARLKDGTKSLHDRLDARIGEGRPFEDRDRYAAFVLVQHDFHSIVSRFYQDAKLGALLPQLDDRDRLAAVRQDLADLGHAIPAASTDGLPTGDDMPTALGWLYVAEGSNLGAAFLLKAVKRLGLHEEFGAHHLAPAPEGRGLHWKTFTAALDAIELTEEEQQRAIAGANAAFARVRKAVEERLFAIPEVA